MLKDIDDEFDIDVLKPAIKLSDQIVNCFAYDAEGSLNGWYNTMESVVKEYREFILKFKTNMRLTTLDRLLKTMNQFVNTTLIKKF